MDTENKKQFIKKLLYQSCNRGCKETDLIIGQFAKLHINNMSDSELQTFYQILQLADADIYDWYTRKKLIPDKHTSTVMNKILAFEPKQQ